VTLSLPRRAALALPFLGLARPAAAQGVYSQGALVIGRVAPGSRLALDGKPLRVGPGGEYVFGLDRDHGPSATLTITPPGGRGAQQQQVIGELSGGERNRVHLAKVLKTGGNVLMLDEPTNDLDVETLRALEEGLLAFPGCAVVISHDRWFLDRIATHILAFEGDSEVIWFEGNYQDYVADLHRRKGADADQPHRIRYRRLAG